MQGSRPQSSVAVTLPSAPLQVIGKFLGKQRLPATAANSSPSLQLKTLAERRHLDRGARQHGGELAHRGLLAVGEERARRTGVPVPSQKLSLVGVGGKTVDRVDPRAHRYLRWRMPR